MVIYTRRRNGIPYLALVAVYICGASGYLGDRRISISPPGRQIRKVYDGLILTCSFSENINPKGGISLGATPDVHWLDPRRNAIKDNVGRIYVEYTKPTVVKLYITHILEGDAGLYTCAADLEDDHIETETKLILYEEIRFLDTPIVQQQTIGASPLLECIASGQPEPKVWWKFNRQKIPEEGNDKYRYEQQRGLRIFTLTSADNGTYECVAEVESQGNFKYRYIDLEVLFPPVERSPMLSQTVLVNNPVNFSCDVDARPPAKYQWFKVRQIHEVASVKEEVANANKNILTIDHVTKADEAKYLCNATNRLSSLELSAELIVQEAPRIDPMGDMTTAEDTTRLIQCHATGDPIPQITWIIKDSLNEYDHIHRPPDDRFIVQSPYPGLSKLTIRNVKRDDAGIYVCLAKSVAGSMKELATLIVEYSPRVNVSNPSFQKVWVGKSVNFTCTANGLPPPTIVWEHNGDRVTNSSEFLVTNSRSGNIATSTLSITPKKNQPWLYGSYVCLAKNKVSMISADVEIQEIRHPDMPPNLGIINTTASSVMMVVDAPSNGGAGITHWKIMYSSQDATLTKDEGNFMVDFVPHEPILIRGLQPGTQYQILVAAVNMAGVGEAVKFKVETEKLAQQADKPADPVVYVDKANVTDEIKTFKDLPQKNDAVQSPSITTQAGSNFLTLGIPAMAIFVAIIMIIIIFFWCIRRRKASRIFRVENQAFSTYGTTGNRRVDVSGDNNIDDIKLVQVFPTVDSPSDMDEGTPDPIDADKVRSPREPYRKPSTPTLKNKQKGTSPGGITRTQSGSKCGTLQAREWNMMARNHRLGSGDSDNSLTQSPPKYPSALYTHCTYPKADKPFSKPATGESEYMTMTAYKAAAGLDLPPPPDYFLHKHGLDPVNDILDGYHSEENDLEDESDTLDMRVPSGYGEDTYKSFDVVGSYLNANV